MRLAYQIPSVDDLGVPTVELFDRAADLAVAAEAAGFDTIVANDHVIAPPIVGPPETGLLECYTLLAALAARTSTVDLGALVTANGLRSPAMLAKTVTTLDVVSGGRAMLGIGAGWFGREYRGYGAEFGPPGDQFDRLEEALQIIRPMLRGERPSFDGEWYRVRDAVNEPRARPDGPPVMIGGNGERRTLRLVAEHADASNLMCPFDELPRKLAALDAHCASVGRDRSEITVTAFALVVVGDTAADAAAARARRFGWDDLPDDVREQLGRQLLCGDPAMIADQARTRVLAHGVDGLVVTILNPAPADPALVRLVGEALGDVSSGAG